MAVIVLSSIDRLGHHTARLRLGDVLAYGDWRIVLALDEPHPFWLEGRGTLCQVPRGRGAAAQLRKRIGESTAAPRS